MTEGGLTIIKEKYSLNLDNIVAIFLARRCLDKTQSSSKQILKVRTKEGEGGGCMKKKI